MDQSWDAIVVGAGIVGSWTAYLLSKQRCRTLLIEQFPLPHTRGSSHGKSRMFRQTDRKDRYTHMTAECQSLYMQLEKDAGRILMHKTGLLLVESPEGDEIPDSIISMNKAKLQNELLEQAELKRRYPQLQYPDNYRGHVDPNAGLLVPDSCLQALQDLFVRHGGVINDGEKVTSLTDNGSVVTVTSSKHSYTARKVVLNPGPWAKDLLASTGLHLPLKTLPGRHMYWAVKSHDSFNDLPVVVHPLTIPAESDVYRFFYVCPPLEYPGMVKIVTRGNTAITDFHPDKRDNEEYWDMIPNVKDYIKKYLPGIDDKPSIIEPCIYTLTPDGEFIIDHHPKLPNVIIGAGFSGLGFRLAPVVGKLLTEMVTGASTSYDIAQFRISRFNSTSKL